MILIYAYINKFKNYTTQEIIFDHRWRVNFSNNKLSIQYRGQSSASAVIRGDRKPDNLHILVGKTGSGKTNLLQMIGAKHDVRYHRKWEGEDGSTRICPWESTWKRSRLLTARSTFIRRREWRRM